MRQPALSDNRFEKFRLKTCKEQFLDEMEVIIPWKDLTSAIEPFGSRLSIYQRRVSALSEGLLLRYAA